MKREIEKERDSSREVESPRQKEKYEKRRSESRERVGEFENRNT